MAVLFAIVTGIIVKLVGNAPTNLFEDSEAFHIPVFKFEDVEELITKVPKST